MLTEQEHIDQLMDWFDFAKVAAAMQAVGWHWARPEDEGGPQVPDERLLRQAVRRNARVAIRQAIDGGGHRPGKGFYCTGGFHIEAEADNGQLISLYARFTLAEWGTTEE